MQNCLFILCLSSTTYTFLFPSKNITTNKPTISTTSQKPTLRPRTTNPPGNHTEVPPWFFESLKDIAYYLRSHKFNEYDRRYETNAQLAPKEYYKQFPRPPLRSLHWEVHKYCAESFMECVDFLRKRVRQTGSKRTDDTAVVVQEQKWFGPNHTQQIATVDKECRAMREQDDIIGNPFEGPLERFQWRTTASYFMCWYTMKEEHFLKHLAENCDNFAACLDPTFGINSNDSRANDHVEFSCASYSFCPDACCPSRHEDKQQNCWDLPINPCFIGNQPGHRQCRFNRSENVDFRDLVLNRWNVSCECPEKGYEWNSLYGMCVDVDECALGNDRRGRCDAETEVCVNLPGNFRCSCKWGHVRNGKKCQASKALERFVLNRQVEDAETHKNLTIWMKVKKFFGAASSARRPRVSSILLGIYLRFVMNF